MRGFTLAELVVVIAIMIIVTTVVLYNYQNFNSTTLVTNYAYEVAFAIKEAQVYGLSVLSAGNSFQQGYGIHFDNNSLNSPANFFLFADMPLATSSPVGDGIFASTTDSRVKTYNFVGNYKVAKFCAFNSAGNSTCGSTVGQEINNSLDITFVRPNPDARIVIYDKLLNKQDKMSRAEITIVSPQNASTTKMITVYSTGQISIK